MSQFERLNNQEKLLTIARGFLQTVGLVCVKQCSWVEATHHEGRQALYVQASVYNPGPTVFIPSEAKLGVDEGSGMADIRVNRNWKDEKTAAWLDDEYSEYIIDKFIELYPIDLTRTVRTSAAESMSVEFTSA